MFPTAIASESLLTALAAYDADFARMPPSLQPQSYDLVESDLQAIRCLVTDATPQVKEEWRNLVRAHLLLTDALLNNFVAIAIGRAKPVSEADLVQLREAHAAAVAALGAGK
jgi:hypothetical protein